MIHLLTTPTDLLRIALSRLGVVLAAVAVGSILCLLLGLGTHTLLVGLVR